jgi:hypothetical protein
VQHFLRLLGRRDDAAVVVAAQHCG